MCMAIDRLFRSDTDFSLDPTEDRGYIFCPEHNGVAKEIGFDGDTRLFIFGPHGLPDLPAPIFDPDKKTAGGISEEPPPLRETEPAGSTANNSLPDRQTGLSSVDACSVGPSIDSDAERVGIEAEPSQSGDVVLNLGHTVAVNKPLNWTISIKGNPHLMIVGLPGMGKTTCIVNLCEQPLSMA